MLIFSNLLDFSDSLFFSWFRLVLNRSSISFSISCNHFYLNSANFIFFAQIMKFSKIMKFSMKSWKTWLCYCVKCCSFTLFPGVEIIVSGKSLETIRKLCLSTKFPHQEIRWNYGLQFLNCKLSWVIALYLVLKGIASSPKWLLKDRSFSSVNFHIYLRLLLGWMISGMFLPIELRDDYFWELLP